ncbi:hypothetical protein YSY22_19050 [Brevibacillus formosus]
MAAVGFGVTSVRYNGHRIKLSYTETVRIKEILRMDDSLREITRVAPRFIRPCPGRMDLFVFKAHISRLKGATFP